MRTKNKLLSALLALCMALSLVPATASAQGAKAAPAAKLSATLSYKAGDKPKATAKVTGGSGIKIAREIWVELDKNGKWVGWAEMVRNEDLVSLWSYFAVMVEQNGVTDLNKARIDRFEEGKTYQYLMELNTASEVTEETSVPVTLNGKQYACGMFPGSRYNLMLEGPKMTIGSSGQAKKFTVTFNANGGNKPGTPSVSVTSGKTVGKLPEIGRKGYAFKGWYTKKSGGDRATASTKIKKDQTLYARWAKVSVKQAPAPTVKKAGGRKISVRLKKVSGAKGYQVAYSTSSDFKDSKSVTATSLSKTVGKLKKGETYYVRARAYKVDSLKNKVYGKYSKAVKVKL